MPAAAEPRLRIAFGNICTNQWIAGCHYLKNLFLALRNTTAPPIIILYGPSADQSHELLGGLIDEHLNSPVEHQRMLRRLFRLERFLGLPLGLSRLTANDLRRQRVQAVFTPYDEGPWFNLPLAAWLTDFQHRHLPEMFSAAELKLRDNSYKRTARRADRVIVSSRSVLADYERFVPDQAAKGRVVNFTAHPPAGVYATDPGWVCGEYHLPERFLFLPNQFWKHKNHRVVVEALGLLKARQIRLTVACSGNTRDPRNPEYLGELQARLDQLGIRDQFVMLGMIQHDHIYQLIRQSLAVLQPSLFEGWSTSVEETKSVGKRLVISDLPVHHEQAPPAALYFDPHDPEALAERLEAVAAEAQPGPDLSLERAATDDLPRRSKAFGDTFMQVMRELVPG